MAHAADVLEMLIPTGGWILVGDDFADVQWIDTKPITQAEFDAGVAKYDAWKAEQDAKAATNKAALLAKLGITADEAKLLLS